MPSDQRRQRRRTGPEHLRGVGEVDCLAHQSDPDATSQPALANACVENGRLPTRIGTDQQNCIRVLDSGDGRVEQIAGPHRRIEPSAILPAVHIGRPRGSHELLQGEH